MTLAPWIADLKEKAERAAPAPWAPSTSPAYWINQGELACHAEGPVHRQKPNCGPYEEAYKDAQFIAAARSGVPKLIAALELAMEALEIYAHIGPLAISQDRGADAREAIENIRSMG